MTPALDLLDELVLEAGLPPVKTQAVAKTNYSHDAMIDLILADPGISQNQLAARFGYSPSWISQVMSSDAFQAKFAERKTELVDPALRLSVENNFRALALRSQEILMEKLNLPTHQIPDQLVLQTMAIASRAAGYGAKDDKRTPTQEVHNHLHIIGERMVGLLKKAKAETIDVDLGVET